MNAIYENCTGCQRLLGKIEVLEKRIKELEERLNTNSSNSSKPPSQDPFRPNKPKNPSGKPRGGQPGHPGHQRKLLPLEQIKQVHDLKPSICPSCEGCYFDPQSVHTEIRQVVELPEAPPEVTQYNINTCRCKSCGKHVRAEVPPEAQFGFGPRLMAFTSLLSGEFRLSKHNVVALVGKLGIRICSGSVCKIQERAAVILEVPYAEIKDGALKEKALNADESSWKTCGKKRWIWIGAGKNHVYFEIQCKRSTEAFWQVFKGFKGILTTDRFNAYNQYEGKKQICLAHAARDFEKISLREDTDKWIGEQLKTCLKETFDLWCQFKKSELDRCSLIHQIETTVQERMKVLLKAGATAQGCSSKTRATCLDFYSRFESIWTFVYEEGIEPTNNEAERGLRHAVIWRKLSFGTQSEKGEQFVERIMTVSATLKRRAQNSFEYLTQCFKNFIHGGQPPPLPV